VLHEIAGDCCFIEPLVVPGALDVVTATVDDLVAAMVGARTVDCLVGNLVVDVRFPGWAVDGTTVELTPAHTTHA
jgi:hypothetical protein